MTISWIDYWKTCKIDNESTGLPALMKYVGWQTEGSLLFVSEQDWFAYIKHISEILGIADKSSIYEIGCGSGAFLYPLYQLGLEVGGCDVCPEFIQTGSYHMPKAEFEVKEAINITPDRKYSFVISNSVFPHFPNLNYVEQVIKKMLDKALIGIAILDLNDTEHSSKYQQMLMEDNTTEYYEQWWSISQEEIKRIKRVSIHKEWLRGYLQNLGLTVKIEEQFCINKLSSVRFNVFAFKD